MPPEITARVPSSKGNAAIVTEHRGIVASEGQQGRDSLPRVSGTPEATRIHLECPRCEKAFLCKGSQRFLARLQSTGTPAAGLRVTGRLLDGLIRRHCVQKENSDGSQRRGISPSPERHSRKGPMNASFPG